MRLREIGTSGLRASEIGLGCNTFGFFQDATQADACIHRALDVGITFFDMASEHGAGREEELVGKALGTCRRDVLIATKFGQQELIGFGPDGNFAFSPDTVRQGASRGWILQSVEESLVRLGTDYIDLYQLHVVDPLVPPEEVMRALEDLVRQGKVRAIGLAATFAGAADLATFQDVAAAIDGVPFAAMQAHLNMLFRDAEREMLPLLAARRMSLLPYWPLANGLLSGKYRVGTAADADSRFSRIPMVQGLYDDRHWRKIERIRRFADGRGIAMAELALAWLLSRPVVASVIAGASRPEQVTQNARASALRLDEADLVALDRLLEDAPES